MKKNRARRFFEPMCSLFFDATQHKIFICGMFLLITCMSTSAKEKSSYSEMKQIKNNIMDGNINKRLEEGPVNKRNTNQAPFIARIWHGWTTKENANRFETLLKEEVFPGIEKNKPKGYRGAQLLKRVTENEVEFTTIMWFDSIESVKGFAGEEYEKAHIDPKVRPLFIRYDQKSEHIEVIYSNYK